MSSEHCTEVGRSGNSVGFFAGTLSLTVHELVSTGWFCTGE